MTDVEFVERAKVAIKKYYWMEFGKYMDDDIDVTRIPILYSTADDENDVEHDVQWYADIIGREMILEIDGEERYRTEFLLEDFEVYPEDVFSWFYDIAQEKVNDLFNGRR